MLKPAISSRLLTAERLTLGVLLSGVASLALSDFVSPFYWGLVVAVSCLRLWRGPDFSLTEMQASLIGWAGFFWVGLELIMGRAWVVAFTDFLLILSLAVVIEEATPRNHLHRVLVGFFLILGAAVLSDSVLYVLPLACFVWFLWRASQCLYGMQLQGADMPLPSWKTDLRQMLVMVATTSLLFVILPRFDFHSYLKPVQPRQQTSGFSAAVKLGDFARTLDATVVMRIEPLGKDIQHFRKTMMGRYWRGMALGVYNGSGWKVIPETTTTRWQAGDDVALSNNTEDLQFAVYREASDHGFVLVPDGLSGLTGLPASMRLGDQGSLQFDSPPSRRLRLFMQSSGRHAHLVRLRPPVHQEKSLNNIPEELIRWAERVAGDANSDPKKLARLMTELSGWEYDLNAPIRDDSPILSFLKLKRGHCELYASTLVLAARALAIPARIVNGYASGEWNETGGFYLVRQQHAHSWAEVWIHEKWQRFDPTPASRWQLSGVRFPAFDELWESIKLSWYRYVLEFQDSDRSQAITSMLAWIKAYAMWLFAMGAIVVSIIVLKKSGIRLPRPRWRRDIHEILDHWLLARGVERRPYQPVMRLAAPDGIDEGHWRVFVRLWEQQLYGKTLAWNRNDLRRHLRAL